MAPGTYIGGALVGVAVAAATATAQIGCSFDRFGAAAARDGGGGPGIDGDRDGGGGPAIDGGPGGEIDAAGEAASSHLVLSEIKAVASATPSEFIEIYNPTGVAVALADHYLADDDDYFRLPGGLDLALDPLNDFVARFPADTVLAPGGVLVVALNEVGFEIDFGAAPDLAMAGVGPAMTILAGSAAPTITDSGEGVVLFRWDGAADLVTDVDMVLVGAMPTTGNRLADKSGQMIDGPDRDDVASAHLADAATILPSETRTTPNESYERIALDGPFELASGGNGVGGRDATSEDTRATWEQADFGPPTPGTTPLASP